MTPPANDLAARLTRVEDQLSIRQLTARYADRYEKADGEWRFSERTLSFLYDVPLQAYADVLGRLERNLAYDAPRAADYLESLPTWSAHQG